MKTTGKVTGIVSNLVTVEVNGPVSQNELCYISVGDTKLMAEVIKVNGKNAAVQVFESTRGLKNGNDVEFENKMLEATLGPGFISLGFFHQSPHLCTANLPWLSIQICLELCASGHKLTLNCIYPSTTGDKGLFLS